MENGTEKKKNRDIAKENGRSRDLSVMAMNTDKPTLWIMFLSLSALITVFLVKTNPLASVHLQSAGMFIENSWKNRTKSGCQGRQTHSHLCHCHPLWVAHGVENAGGERHRGKSWRAYAGMKERKKERERMAVLNTPEQVVPVRTHCHPLIGSFLIPPYHTVPAYWWGGVRMPRACEASLAPNQSRHKRCPQTIWQARAHRGARTSKNMAPQLPPVPPGRNWYMGIPEHFQRRELNPHVYYEIGYFVPSPPPLVSLSCSLSLSPSPSLQPHRRFRARSCFSHILSINHQLPLYLSLWNRPGFDHDILGCEGGQGCLIFTRCSAWQDFHSFLSLFVVAFAPVHVRVGAFVCSKVCRSGEPKTNSICS